ncbi:MAG: excisionase family DNA-binding protein [Cyanobacteria bacterium J06635_11]
MADPTLRAYVPQGRDIEISKESSSILALYRQATQNDSNLCLKVIGADGDEQALTIPAVAGRLLADVLNQMAEGHAVTLVPLNAELTTQEAADLLNVSRSYLIEQLEAGEILYHEVGRHRRIRAKDLMVYRQKIAAKRLIAVDDMVALSEEMGLYD